MLTAALVGAAFVAGLTGAWSPCGFSMVAVLGPQGHTGGRRGAAFASAAFVPGALLGGAATFGVIATLGALAGGGKVALALGAALAGAAALAEAAGVRIAPQIRRQVPEHWRRVLPLPVAAAAYGVLLGLGFTTFVLTFAVPALAGVSLAVGEPLLGVLVGLAFGAGRALPVVLLAPFADRAPGLRALDLMAERPGILRGFRAADALALGAVALALGTASAEAATRAHLYPAADPSAAGAELAWQVPGATSGVLRGSAGDVPTDGVKPAIGGALVATLAGSELRITQRATGVRVATLQAPGADQLAVSDAWVVFRRSTETGDAIEAIPLAGGPQRVVASAQAPAQLGRPALDGDVLVFHEAGATRSRIVEVNLSSGVRTTLRSATRLGLTNPSRLGSRLVYVEATPWAQRLVLGSSRPTRSRGRTLLRIAPAIRADKGYTTKHGPHRHVHRPRRPAREGPSGSTTTLWTTALAADAAYVTRLRTLRDGRVKSAILRVAR